MMLLDLLHQVTNMAGVLPDPQPEQPPGTDGITTIINWITWLCLIAGVIGFLVSAGYLAFASFTGREINGVKGLVISIFVCVLVTAAGTILAVFV